MTAMTIEQPDMPAKTVATTTPAATVFTLETLLWVIVALAALGMRVVQLGNAPLSEGESALAYEAWRFTTGASPDLNSAGLNPFTFNLTALLFYLFGASDSIARVGAVMGGTLLVLSAWLYRPLVGRGHALGIAILLALSPSVLFFSRNATGAIWSALFAFVLVAAVARWRQNGAWSDALLAAGALGFGLTTDGGFWSVLVAGGIIALIASRRPRDEESEVASVGTPTLFSLRAPGTQVVVAVVVFLLAATGFGTNLGGLGAALNQPVQWLLRLFASGTSLVLPFFFVVLLYELLLVILGVWGGLRLLERQPIWGLFAFVWLATTLLPASLFNSGWATGLLYIALPLALLGGGVVAHFGEILFEQGSWRVDGTAFLVTIALFLYFWINFNLYLSAPDSIKLFSLMIPVVGGALGLAYLYTIHSPATAFRAGGLALLLVFGIITASTSWGVSINRANDPREPLVVQPADSNLRTAAAELAQVSTERYRDPYRIPLGIQTSLGYAPRWYFRQFRDVVPVAGNTDLPEAALLDSTLPPAQGIGQKVFIGQTWQWSITDSAGVLRWLKTRGESNGLVNREAVLYVRLP
jgi:uncharacterized protein (TIGR03663 family)